jgi:ABC-type branched-subunit amino acid transport system substrate-binding protein
VRRLALPLLLVVGCAPVPDPIEPVKIGVLNPLTGQLGSLGPSWEDAARLAAEQINAAGGLFDGRPLELVVEDTETNPTRASEAARDAIEQGAVAIVGPASSGETAETIDTVAGFEMPQISCCATSPALTAEDDWFFRTAPNDLLQAQAVAYIAAEGFTGEVTRDPCPESIVVYRDDSYGSGLAEVFVEQFQGRPIAGGGTGNVVANVSYDAASSDFDAEAVTATSAVMTAFNAAHDAGVTDVCVLLVSFAPDGAAMIAALEPALSAAAGDPAAFEHAYLATDGLFDAAFAVEAGGFSVGVIGTAPTHAANPEYDLFAKAHEARFGIPPGNLTSNMYDAVVLLGLAITASRSIDGPAIRDALFDVSRGGRKFEGNDYFFGAMAEALLDGEDIDYVGPSGALDFDRYGDVVGDYTLWQPVNEGGAYTIVERDLLPAALFAP